MKSPTDTSTNSDAPCNESEDGIAAALERLEAQAESARLLTEDFNAAIEAETNAEIMVLERALKAIAPVRRAICRPIATEDILWNPSGHNYCVNHFPQHGITLAGGYTIEGDPDDPDISCSGSSLVLWADGTFGLMVYTAGWLTCVGGAVRVERTAMPITLRQALPQWSLEELLAALTAVLNEQVERVPPAEKERAIARAVRLATVAALAA